MIELLKIGEYSISVPSWLMYTIGGFISIPIVISIIICTIAVTIVLLENFRNKKHF